MKSTRRSRPLGLSRWFWLTLTWLCIGAGVVGIFLPLLPTTPFLLVAVWAAPKASPALHRWLHRHPHLGPPIRAWREEGAVPLRAKITAVLLLLSSWGMLWWLDAAAIVLWFTGIAFALIAGFLLSRPTARY